MKKINFILHRFGKGEVNPIKYKVIKNFVLYCIKKLGIKADEINIHLVHKDNDLGITTGAYDRANNVYSRYEGRAIPDVIRTLAHEIYHFCQMERGDFNLDEEVPDIGGKIEDEANAMSGRLVKMFVKEFDVPWIHKL